MSDRSMLIGAEAEALEDEEAIEAEQKAAAAKAKLEGEDDAEDDDADDESEESVAPAANADKTAEAKPEETGGGNEEAEEPAGPNLSVPPLALEQVEDFDYEGERGKLLDDRKDLRAQLRNGDIDQDKYDESLDALNDKINALDRRHERNEAAIERNIAVGRAQYQWTLDQTKRWIKETDGIDYDSKDNEALLLSWDAKIKVLAKDPANTDKDAQWFLVAAHRQVQAEVDALAARLGYTKASKDEPKPDPKVAKTAEDKAKVKAAVDSRQPKGKAKSLANLPNADAVAAGTEGEFANLEGLSGLDLERALARMPADQVERYLAGQ